MGVEIVKAAVVHGRSLSGNAHKALVAMSLSALDKPSNGRPASLYWGGWDALALALGYENADRNSAGHNAVARAVRELKKGKHITPMVDAGRGTRQSYLVHPGGIKAATQGEQNAHSGGEQSAHAKGEQNAHQRVSKTLPPRKEQGSTGLTQDISIAHEPQLQTARGEVESKPDPHGFRGRPGEDCERCGVSHLNRTVHPLWLLNEGTA
tara:strand:+ start:1263 stop:1889 length:627 start_codon:yes stop_codon:yes gene_type:complete